MIGFFGMKPKRFGFSNVQSYGISVADQASIWFFLMDLIIDSAQYVPITILFEPIKHARA